MYLKLLIQTTCVCEIHLVNQQIVFYWVSTELVLVSKMGRLN